MQSLIKDQPPWWKTIPLMRPLFFWSESFHLYFHVNKTLTKNHTFLNITTAWGVGWSLKRGTTVLAWSVTATLAQASSVSGDNCRMVVQCVRKACGEACIGPWTLPGVCLWTHCACRTSQCSERKQKIFLKCGVKFSKTFFLFLISNVEFLLWLLLHIRQNRFWSVQLVPHSPCSCCLPYVLSSLLCLHHSTKNGQLSICPQKEGSWEWLWWQLVTSQRLKLTYKCQLSVSVWKVRDLGLALM